MPSSTMLSTSGESVSPIALAVLRFRSLPLVIRGTAERRRMMRGSQPFDSCGRKGLAGEPRGIEGSSKAWREQRCPHVIARGQRLDMAAEWAQNQVTRIEHATRIGKRNGFAGR